MMIYLMNYLIRASLEYSSGSLRL